MQPRVVRCLSTLLAFCRVVYVYMRLLNSAQAVEATASSSCSLCHIRLQPLPHTVAASATYGYSPRCIGYAVHRARGRGLCQRCLRVVVELDIVRVGALAARAAVSRKLARTTRSVSCGVRRVAHRADLLRVVDPGRVGRFSDLGLFDGLTYEHDGEEQQPEHDERHGEAQR